MAGINPWDYAKRSEHSHQTALFVWAKMAERFGIEIADKVAAYTVKNWASDTQKSVFASPYAKAANYQPVSQLKWLHAIHNQGHGDAIRGAKAKAEGVKAGVYDLFLPVPRWEKPKFHPETQAPIAPNYHCGFYLELKVGKNMPTDEQLIFGNDMRVAGYAAETAWGWLEARQKILDYLQISC